MTVSLTAGLRTTGGTQGVGRATTQAVVGASVLVIVLDAMLTKIFVWQQDRKWPNPGARRYSRSTMSTVPFEGADVLSDVSFEASKANRQ